MTYHKKKFCLHSYYQVKREKFNSLFALVKNTFFFFNNVYVNVLMFGRRKNVSQLIFFLKVNLKQIQWNRKCFPIFRTCLLM